MFNKIFIYTCGISESADKIIATQMKIQPLLYFNN